MQKIIRFMGIVIVFVSAFVPVGIWAAKGKAVDKHDCYQVSPQGRFVCDKGPLAGKTFLSREAMMEGLRKDSSMPAKPSKASVSKKKN
ncbi:MAG: hypothetical protein ACT4OO_09295 [Nitrospiraceae bacterium]